MTTVLANFDGDAFSLMTQDHLLTAFESMPLQSVNAPAPQPQPDIGGGGAAPTTMASVQASHQPMDAEGNAIENGGEETDEAE